MSQRHEDSDDETYVSVGSAFELLETAEDVQKAKARKEKEQYVTDKQGRRRFHGAFTGGFSAGYYNTVGTKEGWTPSSYFSSRDQKSGSSFQRPEDFMDDEDLDVHGIAPRVVAPTEQFSQKMATGSKRPSSSQPTVIPGAPPLSDLVVPSRSSVGTRLLQAMGWREGEGVGPKVVKYPAKDSRGPRVYGPTRPRPQAEGEEEGGAEPDCPGAAEGFQFAPRDTASWQATGKEDVHGIGYRGMEEQTVLSAQSASRALYGMSGEAFGTGALEEEPDEDIYGVESMTGYDSTLAAEGEAAVERRFGWTGGHDDSWSLAAFVKASSSLDRPKRYHPPVVPQGFVPLHKFTAPSQEIPIHKKMLTSNERTQLLTDKPGSVFSLLSADDRERLKRAAEAAQQAPANRQPAGTATTGAGESRHPVAPAVNPAAVPTSVPPPPRDGQDGAAEKMPVKGIKPFFNDSAKQKRYDAFAEGTLDFSSEAYRDMTEWEKQREREEFSRAAQVFRPLSSSLASRFLRAGDARKELEDEVPVSDAVQAARIGMFGVLTREVLEWHPHRVVCKRFNIPDPYPGYDMLGVVGEHNRPKGKKINFLHTERLVPVDKVEEDEEEEVKEVKSDRTFVESRLPSARSDLSDSSRVPQSQEGDPAGGEGGEDGTVHEPVTQIRPPMDLFRSIFAESSDDSDTASDSDHDTQPSQRLPSKPSPAFTTTRRPTTSAVTVSDTSKVDTNAPHVAPRHSGNTESRPRWQDLSALTSAPATIAKPADIASHSQSGVSTVDDNSTNNRRDFAGESSTEPKVTLPGLTQSYTQPTSVYGPTLPPAGETHVSRESDDPLPSAATREDRHKHHKRRDSKKEHVQKKKSKKKSRHKESKHYK